MHQKFRLIKVPTHADARGNLNSMELRDYIKWTPKRIYYLTNSKAARGKHAVRDERKLYICMQGTVTAKIHDGKIWHTINLKGPEDGIVIEKLCWREFTDFSPGTVLAIISNIHYDKSRYIYDFKQFLRETVK